MKSAVTFAIQSDRDIGTIRTSVRSLASRLGFLSTAQISIVTAVSELGHNILESGGGELILEAVGQASGKQGIQAMGTIRRAAPVDPSDGDAGEPAQRLSGARRIVDEFEISDAPDGAGTTVTLRKWRP
jgi:anti-sigma regulatory factor (Ser/Thr protein kinase)